MEGRGKVTTRRALGAVLVFVAAGLAVAATFLTFQFMQVDLRPSGPMRYEETFWEIARNDFGGQWAQEPPRLGSLVVAAAALLVAGGLLSNRLPLARFGALVGAGLLVGGLWAGYEDYQNTIREYEAIRSTEFELGLGSGMLALVIATAAGLVGAVAMQEFPPRAPEPESEPTGDAVVIHQADDADDTETPPYGFPVIVEGPK